MEERTDVRNDFDIVDLIRSVLRGDKPVGDDHILAGGNRSWFRCCTEDCDPKLAGKARYNPFGRLRLVKLPHIANENQDAISEFIM